MKKLVLMLSVAIGLVAVAPANADKAFSPTCGNNPGKFASALSLVHHSGSNPDGWDVNWAQNCGVGGTVEVELQRTTDGGAHWFDTVQGGATNDTVISTTSGEANTNVSKVFEFFTNCTATLSDNEKIRGHIWDFDSDSVTTNTYTCPT